MPKRTDSILNSGLFSLPLASLDGASSTAVVSRCASPSDPAPAFLAGEENALVRVLADAVVATPLPYNPLVLYGPTGVGKSSVAHALAALRQRYFGLSRTIATSAADLARSLADAIDTATTADFRSQMAGCELLLIDDLHHLAKKPAAQQFLLSIFDTLRDKDTLIIVTLRHSPQLNDELLPKLTSRLASGLAVNLSPPGQEARYELARQTAQRLSVRIAPDDLQRIVGTDHGLLHRTLTAGHIRQAVFDLATEATFGDNGSTASETAEQDSQRTQAICRAAMQASAKHFGIPAAELKKSTRSKTVAQARGVAMYLARALTSASFAAIGRHFGGRDHTTVLHACRKLAAAIANDAATQRLVDELAHQISSECGRCTS